MKSAASNGRVTFAVLQTRLIRIVIIRIRNGDFTERGLARIMGISQPQIHNVLKGTRKLQPQFADRIMDKFGISVLDLLEDGEVSSEALSRQDPGRRERLELSDVDHSVDVLRSAKGADAIRQAAKELASPSGGAVDSAPVLRAFLNRPVTRILAAPSLRKKAS